MTTKLSQIQDILRSATLQEIAEFTKHFRMYHPVNELLEMIGPAPTVTEEVPKVMELRMCRIDPDRPFTMIWAINLVREVSPTLSLKEAKDYVDCQLGMHPDYVVVDRGSQKDLTKKIAHFIRPATTYLLLST